MVKDGEKVEEEAAAKVAVVGETAGSDEYNLGAGIEEKCDETSISDEVAADTDGALGTVLTLGTLDRRLCASADSSKSARTNS